MSSEIHPALDEFDAAMRQIRSRLAALVDKNERLTQSVEAIHEGVGRQLGETQRENAELTAEANALRRETTRLTGENAEFRTEIQSLNEARRALTAQIAEARVKPVVAVEALADDLLKERFWVGRDECVSIIRRHLADAPTPPADETLAAAVTRVQAETRRECAAMVKREVRLAKSETRSGVNNAILLDLAERMGRGE